MTNEDKGDLCHVINNALCGPAGIINLILTQNWEILDQPCGNGVKTYRERLNAANNDINGIANYLYNIKPNQNE